MDIENQLLVKVGFEYPLSQIKQTVNTNFYLHVSKKTDDSERKTIAKLLKLHHQASGESFITALWAGLLCRLSYSQEMQIGIFTTENSRSIPFSMTENITLQHAGEHIRAELSKSTNTDTADQCRYVIAFQQAKDVIENQFAAKDTTLILTICEKELILFFSPVHIHKNNAEKILGYFKRLLKIANLQKALSKMQFISKDELHRLKFLSRQHTVYEPNHWLEKSICHHFKQQVKKNINKIAVKDAVNSYTFLELDALSDNLAHTLKNLQIQKGDYVATIVERNANLIVVMLAIIKLGAAILPINEKYPNDRIESILDNAKPKLVIINDTNRIDKKYAYLKLDAEILNESMQACSASNEILVSEDDVNCITYLMYSAYTTGKQPRGVPICQRGLLNLTYWYQTQLKITAHDRISQFASPAFDTFFCETIPSLLLGGSIHIIDDFSKLHPVTLFEWLKKEKISICDLPTAYAASLFNLNWPELSNLRLVKIGGDAIDQYPGQNFSFDIWNTYGSTETTIEAAYFKIHAANQEPSASVLSPSIGRPILGNEFYIVDPFLQPVPEGINGELLIHSPGLSPGYIQHAELTAQQFISYQLEADEKFVYRTGDLVRWQNDGNLELLGKCDLQSKIRGFRLQLAEIEHAFHQLPEVQEALCLFQSQSEHVGHLAADILPNLANLRFPFQENALFTFQNQKFEIMTDDISKSGAGIFGLNKFIPLGSKVHIQIKLPGMHHSTGLNGTLVWQRESRCGIEFNLLEEEKKRLHDSIDYYLSTQNRHDLILKTMSKRDVKLALKRLLPNYTFSDDATLIKDLAASDAIAAEKEIHVPITVLEEKIIAIWKKILKMDHISLNDHFFQIGGNTALATQLSTEIWQAFNVKLPDKIIFELPFVPIMAEFIQSRMDRKQKVEFTSQLDEEKHK